MSLAMQNHCIEGRYAPWSQGIRRSALNFIRWDAVSIPDGEKFSTGSWDQCELSILKNLDSFWFVAIIPPRKRTRGRTQSADHTLPFKWLILWKFEIIKFSKVDHKLTISDRFEMKHEGFSYIFIWIYLLF
jgi:hypothetical protein